MASPGIISSIKHPRSVLKGNSSLKMLGLTFSSKLDLGSYIISIAKTASKKIGALIHSMKFPSRKVALYLDIYSSVSHMARYGIWNRMKYTSLGWCS